MSSIQQQVENASDEQLEQMINLSRHLIEQADGERLSYLIERRVQAEREKLQRVHKHGTSKQKQQLAQHNYHGITPVHWKPGKRNE